MTPPPPPDGDLLSYCPPPKPFGADPFGSADKSMSPAGMPSANSSAFELDSMEGAAAEFEESGVVAIWALAEPSEKASAAHSKVMCLKRVRPRSEVISVPRKD